MRGRQHLALAALGGVILYITLLLAGSLDLGNLLLLWALGSWLFVLGCYRLAGE